MAGSRGSGWEEEGEPHQYFESLKPDTFYDTLNANYVSVGLIEQVELRLS